MERHGTIILVRSDITKSRDRGDNDMADEEWITQEDIANQIGAPVDRVRAIVATLSSAGVIKTQRNPLDRRYVLVHRDSIERIKQTIFGS
jgi:DNA-binding MarR family transcriptional regulator